MNNMLKQIFVFLFLICTFLCVSAQSHENILFQVFKAEALFEVWVQHADNEPYKLFETYSICDMSGKLGPKREQGDKQVPEGFYAISELNPKSRYGLSLKISYPNQSDQLLKTNSQSGGLIYIHGSCTSIGCISFKNETARELYRLASNNGGKKIPVYIFPARLTDFKCRLLKAQYSENTALLTFWENLREGYDQFDLWHFPLKYTISESGKYMFSVKNDIQAETSLFSSADITSKGGVSLCCDSLMSHIERGRFAQAQTMCIKKCVLDYLLYLNIPKISHYKILSEKSGKDIAVVKVQLNNFPAVYELVFTKKTDKWQLFYIKPQPGEKWIWYTCIPDDNLYIKLLDFEQQP